MTTPKGIDAVDEALERIDFNVAKEPTTTVSEFFRKISEDAKAVENPSTPVTLSDLVKMVGKVARQSWVRGR